MIAIGQSGNIYNIATNLLLAFIFQSVQERQQLEFDFLILHTTLCALALIHQPPLCLIVLYHLPVKPTLHTVHVICHTVTLSD